MVQQGGVCYRGGRIITLATDKSVSKELKFQSHPQISVYVLRECKVSPLHNTKRKWSLWETAKHVKSKESEQICLKLNVVPKGKQPNMKNSNMKNWRRKSTE